MPNPDNTLYLFTLTPRTSKQGNKYYTAQWGSVYVSAFFAKDGERINVYFTGNVERKEQPGPNRSQERGRRSGGDGDMPF